MHVAAPPEVGLDLELLLSETQMRILPTALASSAHRSLSTIDHAAEQ